MNPPLIADIPKLNIELSNSLLYAEALVETIRMAKKELNELELTGRNIKAADMELPPASSSVTRSLFKLLSVKEHAVLQLILARKTYAKASTVFGISEGALKAYSHRIQKKLGVSSRKMLYAVYDKPFSEIHEADYLHLAGIPKQWSAQFTPNHQKMSPSDPLYRDIMAKVRIVHKCSP
jgi:DNA-binding CsgD family transcriptional regulator